MLNLWKVIQLEGMRGPPKNISEFRNAYLGVDLVRKTEKKINNDKFINATI